MAEPEEEMAKLINVMRRLARNAHFSAPGRIEPDADAFCAAQYHRALARLAQMEPKLSTWFPPLAPSTGPEAVSLTARAIIAYLDAEQAARSQTVDFTLLDMFQKAIGRGN